MTCSTSCSSRAGRRRALPGALALAVALAVALAGPAAARAEAAEPLRVAVFPPENLSGGAAPLRELRGYLESALASRGFDVVAGEPLERFLAAHRLRYTGGLDRVSAKAAGAELGVKAVLITSVELIAPEPRPAFGLTLRLVSADEEAALLWIDGAARSGEDGRRLLGLGVIESFQALQGQLLGELVDSLAAFTQGKGRRAPQCPDDRRFRPKVPYRSPTLAAGQHRTVAVVPFRNLTRRRGGGDLVSLAFVRGLAGDEGFQVFEPGVIRALLLEARIIMEGGVSLDQVRTLLGALEADLVLAGDVLELSDATGAPVVTFTATLIDSRTGEIVWQSTSSSRGDDGVWLFDRGLVATPAGLACRMVRSAVASMRTQPPVNGPERSMDMSDRPGGRIGRLDGR